MSEKLSAFAEKLVGAKYVSAIAVEMRDAIIELAGERGWFDTRDSWLRSAANKAGVSHRMAKAIFYAEIADPKASVVESIRSAVVAQRKAKNSIKPEAHREHEEITGLLDALEARLSNMGPHLFGDEIAALREAVCARRGMGGALDQEPQ